MARSFAARRAPLPSRYLLFALLAGAAAPAALAQVQVVAGHPRLVLGGSRGVSDATLQARCANPGLAPQCALIGSYGHLLDLAMDWRLHGNAASAASAVQALLGGLSCGDLYEQTDLGGYALAYDWVWDYPAFTPAQKAQVETALAGCCASVAAALAGNSPHLWHGFGSQAAALALAALALDTDPRRTQALLDAETYFRRRTAEAYGWIDGAWPEGLNYERSHFFSNDPPSQYVIDALRAWHSAVVQDSPSHAGVLDTIRYQEGDWLRRLGLFHLYALLPPHGTQTRHTWLAHGDLPTGQGYPNKQYRPFLDAIASVYGMGELQWLGQLVQAEWGFVGGSGSYHPIHRYAIPADLDPTLAATPPDALPLDAVFGRGSMGYVFLRSGWADDARLVHFRAGDWFTGHQHMDQGHLEIGYRGPLAVDAGVYAAWGSEHREAFYMKTVAHNSILVRVPGETFASGYGFGAVNDGGQRVHTYTGGAQTIQSLAEWQANVGAGRHYEAGDLTAFTSEADFAHTSADLTPAYNSDRYAWGGNAAKVRAVERALTYFRPGLLVVCDRVRATDPGYETSWTLHSTVKPATASETLQSGTPTDGILESTDPAFVVDNTTGGKLFASLLLPARVTTRKLGGPSYRYWVDGANRVAGSAGLEGPPATPGLWRVEVRDPAALTDHVFLSVLEIADGTQPAATAASTVSVTQGTVVGALVASLPEARVAVFAGAPAARPAGLPIRYALAPAAPALHVVADLEPLTTYLVTTSDGVARRTSDAEGVLWFRVAATGSQEVIVDGGCAAAPGPVTGLLLSKDGSSTAALTWDPLTGASDGYHAYDVTAKEDLPAANTAGNPVCAAPPAASPGCSDTHPLAEPAPLLRCYQVVGVCAGREGPL